ncbi:trafficking protein particle complex subunit 14-like [Asterias amurensis]|uniref:trafficking protein particle complex subunit 14-like n=1 Tax=Asterias amurensis TaxID=7602 RepID=UPI003AB2C6CB
MADDLDVLQKECKFELVFPSKEPTDWLQIKEIPPRCKIYSGERINFALVVQYVGENGCKERLQDWQSAVRSVHCKANVGCSSATENNALTCITKSPARSKSGGRVHSSRPSNSINRSTRICKSFATFNIGKSATSSKESEPIVHEDLVIFPLSASLTTLPSSLRTLIVSVHITSQATSRRYTRDNNYLDLLTQMPMEDVFQLQRPLLRCTVKAELSILPPPEIRCQHVAVAGKHFLIIKVNNDYAEKLILDHVQVLWNKNHSLQHSSHPAAWLHRADQVALNDILDEMDSTFIEMVTSSSYNLPLSLQPLEQHAFVFQLHFSQFWRNKPAKGTELPLLLSLTWFVPSMVGCQTVCTHYSLPSLRLDFPSFIMSAQCESPVQVGDSFNVNYTLLNNLQDFLGITLLWMPGNRSMTDTDETSSRFIEESIVCQQPKIDLGVCIKGSTTDVSVTFQAVRSGVHEIGKFMKLKLQYATPPNHQPQPSTAPSSPSIIPPVTTATTSSDTSQTNTFPRRDRRRFKRPTLPRQHSFSSLYQRFQISGNRSRSNSFTSDDDTHSLPGDLADRGESASCNSLNGSSSVTNSPVKTQQVTTTIQPPKPSVSIDKIAKRRCKVYIL